MEINKNGMCSLKSVLMGKTESDQERPSSWKGCVVACLLCQTLGTHTESTQSKAPARCLQVSTDSSQSMTTTAEYVLLLRDVPSSVTTQGKRPNVGGQASKGFRKEVTGQLWTDELAFEMNLKGSGHGKISQVQETK